VLKPGRLLAPRPGRRPPASRPAGRTLSDRIAAAIRDGILSGEYPGGKPLRQAALAERLGVSPIPVREALRRLEGEGLVSCQPFRGAVVASLSAGESVGLLEVWSVLHALGLRLVFPLLTPARLDRAQRAAEAAMRERDPDRYADRRFRVHETLYAPLRRPRFLALVRLLDRSSRRYGSVWARLPASHTLEPFLDDHLARLREGDLEGAVRSLGERFDRAAEVMAEHLGRMKSEPGRVAAPVPQRRRTLADRIAERVRREIVRGKLAGGEALPQVELARRLGVSAIPLRESLRLLENEGLVRLEPYRGAVVTPLSAGELAELTDLRRSLEALALRRAVPALMPRDASAAHAFLRKAAAATDPASAADLVRRFTLALLAPADRPFLLGLVAAQARATERYEALLPADARRLHLRRLSALLAACRRRDLASALELNDARHEALAGALRDRLAARR